MQRSATFKWTWSMRGCGSIGRACSLAIMASPLLARSQLLLNDRLQRFLVLHAGERLVADHEHRDAGDPRFLVGVPQRPLVRLPVLPGPQRLAERLLVQPDLAGQLR